MKFVVNPADEVAFKRLARLLPAGRPDRGETLGSALFGAGK